MAERATQRYEGPFVPPPDELLTDAIGWRFAKASDGPGRWKPVGWQVVYPDHILTVDYTTQLGMCDSLLYAP